MLQLLRGVGVDLFNVSSRRFYKPEWPDSEHPDYSIAEWAKSLTDAPVMTCGSVGLDVEMFANLSMTRSPRSFPPNATCAARGQGRRGTLDLVGVGRTHIATTIS
ncbi:MAG: hypothetical protein WDO68_19515 [Gammaproteobacteria bacterium]